MHDIIKYLNGSKLDGQKGGTHMLNIIQKDIEGHAFGLISLFDEQFSFEVFSESIQTAEHEADSILAKAKLAVEKAVKKEADDYKLVVDLDEDTVSVG